MDLIKPDIWIKSLKRICCPAIYSKLLLKGVEEFEMRWHMVLNQKPAAQSDT